ncbi:MAG: ABC transporter substrate-binding protein, partial [Actinobacteria bacterium]|nr:ABC transporter substrate-binding protein [Actinomycetota bacterium]
MARPINHSAGRPQRSRPRRLLLPSILLPALLAVMLGAGLTWGLGSALADDPSASPGAGKVVLHVGWTNDPDNLNPFIGAETSSYEIWLLNYDFLVGYSTDLQPTPGLATSWETSPDGKVWTFHLREGVTWQDGEPFTAADVAFTYNYIVENDMGAFSSLTTFIDKAVAIDDLTVEIRCSKPKANMISTWIPILPEHVWSKVDPKKAGASYQSKPPLVGTGPFQTVEVKKGDYVRMVANPSWWGEQKPAVDEILFVTYQNPDTMTQDLLSGTLDAAWGIPSAQFPKLEGSEGFEAIAYNLLTWDYLALNCYEGTSRGNPVLRDVAFRQALNWAIDRQKVADLSWAGNAEPGTTIMTPGSWVDPDYHWEPPADVRYTYDPEKAKQLLDAAGYVDSDGDGVREDKSGKPIKLRLWARSESPESQKTGSLITDWFRDIGLKIQYQVMDDGIYYDSIWAYQGDDYSPDFDMYLWDWDGYADPGDTLASFTTAQIENWNEPCW